MKIKTIQWNIGGGKTRKIDADPLVEETYTEDGIIHIGEIIKKYNPDIVFLQEVHRDKKISQARIIANLLGAKSYFTDVYARSHLEEGQELGQSIISKFPIKNHKFELFLNPQLKVLRPNGKEWISHDKGISSCIIEIDKKTKIHLKTLHLVPFRKFNISPLDDVLKKVRKDIVDKIKCDSKNLILEGDFNYDDFSLKGFLPDIFSKDIQEVVLKEPTEASGKKYDHIIYKGLKHHISKVISTVLTDHFLVYSEFKLPNRF